MAVRMNSKMYTAILSALKRIGKISSKAVQVRYSALAKSDTWPESKWTCISHAEGKKKEQPVIEDSRIKGLADHQWRKPASADV